MNANIEVAKVERQLSNLEVMQEYRLYGSVEKCAEHWNMSYGKARLLIRVATGKSDLTGISPKFPEDKAKELYDKNNNDFQIARALSKITFPITKHRVKMWRKRRHLPAVKQTTRERQLINADLFGKDTGGCTSVVEFNIVNLVNQAGGEGLTATEIALGLGISLNYAYIVLRRMGTRKLVTKQGKLYKTVNKDVLNPVNTNEVRSDG